MLKQLELGKLIKGKGESSPIQLVAIILLLFAGLGITIWGFYSLASSPEVTSWRWGGKYFLLAVLLTLVVAILARRCLDPLLAAVMLGALIALSAGLLVPVFVVAVLSLSAFALGRMLFPSLSVTVVDSLLIGMTLFATLFGLLAHFPVGFAGVYGVLFALPLMVGRRFVIALVNDIWSYRNSAKLNNRHEFWLGCTTGGVALLHFLVSLMPEVGHDALSTHLFVPAHIVERGAWGFNVNLYAGAVMPMLIDWLYAAGYMFAGEVGARLVNCGGIILLVALTRRIAYWVGASSVAAAWGGLVLLATPLTFTESSSLFIEGIWSALLVGGVFSILRLVSLDSDSRQNILVAAILLGGALAAKAVTLTAFPVLVLIILLSFRQWFSRELIKTLGMGVVVFLLLGSIPYVTAFLLTGNPLFPFFNAFFQSSLYPPENFNAPDIFERGMKWNTLYRIMFDSGMYLESTPGAPGFQWLILVLPSIVIAGLVRDKRSLLVLLIAVGAWWLTFNQTAYLRYVFPFVALALVIVAAGLTWLSVAGVWPWRIGVVAAAFVVTLNLLHLNVGTYYGKIDFRVIANKSIRDSYIESVIPLRRAVDLVNVLNAHRAPVAFFSEPLTAGLKSDALYANWYNYQFATAAKEAKDASDIGKLLAKYAVEYVVVDDTWGGGAELLSKVVSISTEVSRIGSVTIRRLQDGYRFSEELLQQQEVQPGEVWHFTKGASFVQSLGAVVSVESPAYASVPIVPGRRYRYTAIAMCEDEPTEGRLQVNWVNTRGQLIKVDIHVFTCTPERADYSIDFAAPVGASNALIYASGHTRKKLVFSRVSLRS